MNIWEVLGINPTRNKKEIKRAYAQKVKQCHSEDNPVEWERLHEAYSRALKYADGGNISGRTYEFFEKRGSTTVNTPSVPDHEELQTDFNYDSEISNENQEKQENSEKNYFDSIKFDELNGVQEWNQEEVSRRLGEIFEIEDAEKCASEFEGFTNSPDIRILFYTPLFWKCIDSKMRQNDMHCEKAHRICLILSNIYEDLESLMDNDTKQIILRSISFLKERSSQPKKKSKVNTFLQTLGFILLLILIATIVTQQRWKSSDGYRYKYREKYEDSVENVKEMQEGMAEYVEELNNENTNTLLQILFRDIEADRYPDHNTNPNNYVYTVWEGAEQCLFVQFADNAEKQGLIICKDEELSRESCEVFDNLMIEDLLKDIRESNSKDIDKLLNTKKWKLEIELSDKEKTIPWLSQLGTQVYAQAEWANLDYFARMELEKRKFMDCSTYNTSEIRGSLGKLVFYVPGEKDYSEEQNKSLEKKLDKVSDFYRYYDIEVRSLAE